jgi:hypothetical protein
MRDNACTAYWPRDLAVAEEFLDALEDIILENAIAPRLRQRSTMMLSEITEQSSSGPSPDRLC